VRRFADGLALLRFERFFGGVLFAFDEQGAQVGADDAIGVESIERGGSGEEGGGE
jgi:hypothetical protein